MINVLEQYHDGLDTKKMYHRIGKSYEELVPRFLNHCTMEHIHNNDIAGFYRPFEDPIDMDEYSPDSIFHMMYKPTLEVVPQISNSRALTLDDIFFCYNKAFGIALHALNCVERPCEYFDSYFPSVDILNRIIIMGIVYNLLKEDNDNIYMGILLDKIETELIAEAPEFLNIVISSSKSTKKGAPKTCLFTGEVEEKQYAEHFRNFLLTNGYDLVFSKDMNEKVNIALMCFLYELNINLDGKDTACFRFLEESCGLEYKTTHKEQRLGQKWCKSFAKVKDSTPKGATFRLVKQFIEDNNVIE
jgi:hypothetical protein